MDDFLKDNECLEISRVRVSDVSVLGVNRGRARDEEVWSFSDRPGIPEPKLVGVRAGVGRRPRREGFVLRLKDVPAVRPVRVVEMKIRIENLTVVSKVIEYDTRFFFFYRSSRCMLTFSPPDSGSWLTSRLFIDAGRETIPDVEPFPIGESKLCCRVGYERIGDSQILMPVNVVGTHRVRDGNLLPFIPAQA